MKFRFELLGSKFLATGVRRDALLWSLDIYRRSRRKFAPRRGWRTQPRVSTLGTDQLERRALKGRQSERPNKVEVGGPMANSNTFNCAP
jgi:hypothetical protein